ncbi:Rv3235 family protein [Nocardioides sp.]|uniref:Rv3235 family protein n=1 Tax=Nocardioides sp. TaxID=35761 RepID=UPI0026381EBE|nr:Rv3235 family protein [Nocardioides sp.]
MSARPATIQGTLALDLLPRTEPPMSRPERTGSGADVIAIESARRGEIELWATRFTQAAVEIVGGDRPAHQIARWATPMVYADLRRRSELVALASGQRPGEARIQPVHPKVIGIHTCFVTSTIVEASVHVRYGERSRAVAGRFERREGRWLCTALDFA